MTPAVFSSVLSSDRTRRRKFVHEPHCSPFVGTLYSPLPAVSFWSAVELLGTAAASGHSRISSTTPSASTAPTTQEEFRDVLRYLDYIRWPYTLQSTILLVLFILWMIIGLFVAREVLLVVLDHRKIKRKPQTSKTYHGAYSVKRKRYVREKNYQPVANGGNEQV